MIETRLVHVGTGTVIERRDGDRLAELDRLKDDHERVLHGICDALHEGYPTGPILRGLLKDTEHEPHVVDLVLGVNAVEPVTVEPVCVPPRRKNMLLCALTGHGPMHTQAPRRVGGLRWCTDCGKTWQDSYDGMNASWRHRSDYCFGVKRWPI